MSLPATRTQTRTQSERFQEWKRLALHPKAKWVVDLHKNGQDGNDLLIYHGKDSGFFIWVGQDGTVRVGMYKDALPHIGHAQFATAVALDCGDFDSGLERILTACKMTMLLGLLK